MKKTAVEWLIQKHFGGIENCTPHFRKHIEQAKEMEKDQMLDIYINHNQYNDNFLGFDDYYKETFKSE